MMVGEDTNDHDSPEADIGMNERDLYNVRPEHDRRFKALPLGGKLASFAERFIIRDSYRITSKRIVIEHDGGILGTDTTKEYPLRSIADIESYSTFTQRRFDCGTVTFTEHDGSASEIEMEWIPNHDEIADTLRRLATEEQARHRNPSGNPDGRGL